MIGPLVAHRLPVQSNATVVYVEPQTRLGQLLRRDYPDAICRLSTDAARNCLAVLERTVGRTEPEIDHRLAQALSLLDGSPCGPAPIEAAAHAVGLSASRLRAIADLELDVPLVRWVLWRKLSRAGEALAAGAGLADAALSGGFSDQAHFSRTMKAMVGLTPSIAATSLRAQGRRAE
ncbi:MAG TPA: helix-turn-helix domain-containing protein [Aliidongia sp.]|uniref:helix-turn-helix domain-containing protein n=1 Tax=Aliidongia sp. TaxID=1914230 RepID=UPI002DDD780D|nr:helix-turn-helix domain-containing protein [Aliidongia sp.]HEV2673516.1 helix-turn-helix domain-containing protein [Aliidongia sp.]